MIKFEDERVPTPAEYEAIAAFNTAISAAPFKPGQRVKSKTNSAPTYKVMGCKMGRFGWRVRVEVVPPSDRVYCGLRYSNRADNFYPV